MEPFNHYDFGQRFVGTLHETDVMSAYNRALVDARREEHDGHL